MRARLRSMLQLLRAALSGETGSYVEGDLRRAVIVLAIPMVLEMSMEALFTLVDVFFVARISEEAVATVGLTEAMNAILFALAFGLAMPATAVVARRAGEGDEEGASRAGAQALWLGLGLGLTAALAALFAPQLLALMGASDEVVRVGAPYTRLSLAGAPVVVLLFVNNAVLRGAGDATRAMRALWLANGLNIALDPCLIFGLGPFPELGLEGAAIATLIGRSAGVLYQLAHLLVGSRLRLRGRLGWRPKIARALLRRSVGGTVQHLVETGCWVVLARIVAGFGSVAMAGYTVGMRVIIFSILPAWGLSNATATLVGQSLGAGDPARAERAIWISGRYATAFLGMFAVLFLLAPGAVARAMGGGAEVEAIARSAVFTLAFGYVFYGWHMVAVQAFNGAGDTTTPAWINLFCFWLVLIPLAWTLAHPLGLGVLGVFIAVTSCYSLAAVCSVLLVRRGTWKRVVV